MSATPRSAVTAALAADRLGASSVASFALTAAAPLMVVGGFLVAGWATTEVVGIPLAIILIGVVLALFSVGYVSMARRITNAGAFYSYIAQGIGRPFGVAASLVALLAYNVMQFGLFGILGAATSGFLGAKFDLDIKWWMIALGAWVLTAILGVTSVEINSKVLLTLLVAEVVIVLIYDGAFVSHPATSVGFEAFNASDLISAPALGAVLITAITAFIGFEAAPVFAEESKDARRTIPLATFLGLGVMVFLYAATSWAMTVVVGSDKIVAASQEQSDQLIFNQAGSILGSTFADIGSVLLITSAFAAMLSYHNTVARYTFALAREGVLPRALAQTGARSGAPQAASALQSFMALAVIVAYAFSNLDPVFQLFFWGGALGGFGILALLIFTSIAVISYFARSSQGEPVWRWTIAPVLAIIPMSYTFYLVIDNFSSLLGVEPTDNLRWILPSMFGLVAVLGFLWAFVLRATKPETYRAIGLGAAAASPSLIVPVQGAAPGLESYSSSRPEKVAQ